MATQVEICNIALSRIRVGTISSITEDTEPAKACNRIYDQIAENVMAAGPWTTATYRATLARTTTTPTQVLPVDFAYEFQLPVSPKFLKIISISEDMTGDVPYVIEGDKLLTDEDAMKIQYIGFIESTANYGPFLTQAIISRLAAELSYTFSGNGALSQSLFDQAQEDLLEGLAMDGQQGSKRRFRTSTLIDPRTSW